MVRPTFQRHPITNRLLRATNSRTEDDFKSLALVLFKNNKEIILRLQGMYKVFCKVQELRRYRQYIKHIYTERNN